MERLTERSENGTAVYKTPSSELVKWNNNRHKVLQKLADYEDLGLTPEQIREMDRAYSEQAKELGEYKDAEKQGKLLKLPCAVGDRIYRIDTDEKLESREIEIYDIDNIVILVDGTILLKYDAYDGVICELENIVSEKPYLDFYRCFLTKSAAEQALKEMEDKHE